ncbi:MAG: YggS family pyridoxal phosphate-dependent enzyme [Gammaproteobacteria bacterium]
MGNIAENLKRTRDRIHAAEQEFGRRHDSVKLLAVSKARPVEMIRQAVIAGQREFGENYVQEAVPKIQALRDENLIWHFIGPIQSNKTRLIAEYFDWVHSVDRIKVAHRLSADRSADQPPLNICIQVNISAESSKSGLKPVEAGALAREVANLPGLRLRGLMVIPAAHKDLHTQRVPFHQTAELLQALNDTGLSLDTLSMGMSDDLEAAVAEGATMVRVGTAIFGARQS